MSLEKLVSAIPGAVSKRKALLLNDRERRIFELGFMAGFNAASDAALEDATTEPMRTIQAVQKRLDGAK